jgi:malate synthase
VAHPDLVPVAREIFERVLGEKAHQKDRLREDVQVAAKDLADIRVPNGQISEKGLRGNVNIALQYLYSWLEGNGAAAIYNLMEDTATAEISRAQLWQWLYHQAKLDDDRLITPDLYEQIRAEELTKLGGLHPGRYQEAAEILDQLILGDNFIEFLTFVAYPHLD